MNRHLVVSLLDQKKLIKRNESVKEVSNPMFFNRNNAPTSDGLLSNEIFGITKDTRSGTFAYIDLHETFLNPLVYKIWCKVDRNIKAVVHGTKNFSINSNGELVEDENGKNGIKFLKDNMDKIKYKKTKSISRDRNIEFLIKNRDNTFIEQFIIIPAYYRDINTDKGYVGVGEINKLYANLLVSLRSLKESAEYGLSLTSATRGRIQELMLQIYNWFGGGTTIDGIATSPMLPSKFGVIRRAGLRKTTDYGSRLVLSGANLRAEKIDDIQVDMDHSLVPLSSICANFYPFMLFHVRRFFEIEFSGVNKYNYIDKNGKSNTVTVKDYQVEFSDERIKKEMDRFIHGFSNRLIPIKIPNVENKEIYMKFKGFNTDIEDIENKEPGNMSMVDRRLTWCDVFYIAAQQFIDEKNILITRYPIDSMYNQFTTKVRISTTRTTEPMIINDKVYTNYPKIREQDIGSNTSNKFIDTMVICNAYLSGIGGDYDGDQVSIRGVYSDEANEELRQFMNSKINYVQLGARPIRETGNECIQSLYSLTLVLPDTKLIDPIF